MEAELRLLAPRRLFTRPAARLPLEPLKTVLLLAKDKPALVTMLEQLGELLPVWASTCPCLDLAWASKFCFRLNTKLHVWQKKRSCEVKQ